MLRQGRFIGFDETENLLCKVRPQPALYATLNVDNGMGQPMVLVGLAEVNSMLIRVRTSASDQEHQMPPDQFFNLARTAMQLRSDKLHKSPRCLFIHDAVNPLPMHANLFRTLARISGPKSYDHFRNIKASVEVCREVLLQRFAEVLVPTFDPFDL